MKIQTKFLLLLVVTISCTEKQINEDTTVSKEIESVDYTGTFKADLEFGQYSFAISSQGTGSLRKIEIEGGRPNFKYPKIEAEIDGTITNIKVVDLNQDKYPELYCFANSSGSGSYGNVYGYIFESDRWTLIQLPELRKKWQQGYMGHDEFSIKGGRIIRQFPVYKKGDPNANPTGGTRRIEYTLIRKGGTYKLRPAKIDLKKEG